MGYYIETTAVNLLNQTNQLQALNLCVGFNLKHINLDHDKFSHLPIKTTLPARLLHNPFANPSALCVWTPVAEGQQQRASGREPEEEGHWQRVSGRRVCKLCSRGLRTGASSFRWARLSRILAISFPVEIQQRPRRRKGCSFSFSEFRCGAPAPGLRYGLLWCSLQ